MILTRRRRIVLELLAPAPLGAGLLFMVGLAKAVWERFPDGTWPGFDPRIFISFAIVVGFAYIFTGLQSIAYAIIMEWRFARGLDPRSWRSVGLSTLLGFLSGAAICVGYGLQRSDSAALWVFFGGSGVAAGFILGLLVRRWSLTSARIAD